MTGQIPVLDIGMGPGSHVEDELSYMPMPHEMNTFAVPSLPEPEEVGDCPDALELLARLQEALDSYQVGTPGVVLDLGPLPEQALTLLEQILGEGEVSVQTVGACPACIQETVLAGVWWGHRTNGSGGSAHQWLEVADIPAQVIHQAFARARWPQLDFDGMPQDLINAGPVLVELLDVARQHAEAPRSVPHVINLSLLPFSPEDQRFLSAQLGEGGVALLSRGYGNCRVGSTATPGIWRVQYFNSTDQLILDTLEVTTIPQVACAAQEDIEDSAERLREIREVLL